jgi:hypothetical protein
MWKWLFAGLRVKSMLSKIIFYFFIIIFKDQNNPFLELEEATFLAFNFLIHFRQSFLIISQELLLLKNNI